MRALKQKLGWLMTVLLFSNTVFASGGGKLVLVLDDLGNQLEAGKRAIDIDWVTTVAIMPARPFSEALAHYAHEQGKEVIIHAPMSNTTNFPLGPLGLTRSDGKAQLIKNVQQTIASVPHAIGLSNHMGSRLTQDADAMAWVMAELKTAGFYFYDSKTVAASIAWQVAEQFSIPWAQRDIFLDHFKTAEFMAKQWAIATAKVMAGEQVSVICHPYPETLAFLNALTPNAHIKASLSVLSDILKYPKPVPRSDRNIPQGS